jgi:hypothetical protein
VSKVESVALRATRAFRSTSLALYLFLFLYLCLPHSLSFSTGQRAQRSPFSTVCLVPPLPTSITPRSTRNEPIWYQCCLRVMRHQATRVHS